MDSWLIKKVKSANEIVDYGVLTSIFTGLLVLLIYCYKFVKLKLMGVPINIAVNIVDINLLDYVVAFVLVIILSIFAGINYLLLYSKSWKKKFKNIIVILLGFVFINFLILEFDYEKFNKIFPILFVILVTYLIFPFFLKMIINRPVGIIKKIINGDKFSEKFVVILSEAFSMALVLITISLYLSNVVLLFPSKKVLIDNRILLYNSSKNFLVADYSIRDNENGYNKIKIKEDSFEIIIKEKNLKRTDNEYIYDYSK